MQNFVQVAKVSDIQEGKPKTAYFKGKGVTIAMLMENLMP